MVRFARSSCVLLALTLCGCPGPETVDGGLAQDAPSDDATDRDGGRDDGGDAGANDAGSDGGVADASSTAELTLTLGGVGGGSVASLPTGIRCGSSCSATFAVGTRVTLTASPDDLSTFTVWGGTCSGVSPTCTFTIVEDTTVTATFGRRTEIVSVAVAGNGSGNIRSSPGTIVCGPSGSACSDAFDVGSVVTLTHDELPGTTFTGWSGACTGTADCVITVAAASTVTGTFTLDRFTLDVLRDGNGTGTVNSSPAGISCGSTCTATLDYGSRVVLTATPGPNSTFVGWSGGGGECASTGPCPVYMDRAKTITATYALEQHVLSVSRIGGGMGLVTSSPAGLSCGGTCEVPFDHGTSVTLTATPAIGSIFTGWSGDCSGTGTCTVSLTANASVSAMFTLESFTLSVGRTGSGTGSITSGGGEIACGASCAALIDYGRTLTLTASPAVGSSFTGWSGACSGTGPCTLTVTGATSVTASFSPVPVTLTVVRPGTGVGVVTSVPVGISCGSTCSAAFDYGTPVTLTAAPNATSTFTGWSGGGCSGTGTCTVTMTAATTVTATFAMRRVNLTVTSMGGLSRGTVGSSPAGISCGATCTSSFDYGTTVVLTSTGGSLDGWSGGGCSGTGTCSVTLTSDTAVTATYRLRVGIEASTSSCLRSAGNVIPRLSTLLTARGQTPVVVSSVDIDSLAELLTYDVIVTTGYGDTGCNAPDLAAVDPFLDPYVRAGGGLVASGWTLYQVGVTGAPNLAALLPTNASTAYLTGPQTLTPVSGSPITAGLGAFVADEWIPTGSGTRATAQTILGAGDIGASWSVGAGRTVFLGPMYLESWAAYSNESLLDGTQPNATELFLRSIEWAGRRL